MTGLTKREVLEAVRPRYLKASKAEKGHILDEFVATMGYHRKYAIHLTEAKGEEGWTPPEIRARGSGRPGSKHSPAWRCLLALGRGHNGLQTKR